MADNVSATTTAPAAQPQTPQQNATGIYTPPKINFQPNILDSAANYTYHIRWSMCTQNDSQNLIKSGNSAQFRNGINKIIIAESGKTAQYNIVDFSINTLLPASPTTPQTVEVTAEMTIVEPYGLTLTDNLFVASKGIGINNYLTDSCYFIDMWFKGYNEDGTVNGQLDSIYKCWAVTLKKLESTTTESGTTYKLEFLCHNMYAAADHVQCLPSSFTIPASNIGQFLDNLGAEWTKQNGDLYEDKKPRITYKFSAPFAKSWAFDKSPTTSQAQNSMKIGEGGIPTFQLGRGQDLVTILNFVISITKDGQNFTVGEPSSGTSNGAGSASMRVNGMTNLIVIHSWSYHNGPFDTKINDYPRTVVYTLVRYPTGRAVANLKNAAETRQPGNQQQRLAALVGSGNFVKHYWWTYTGQNMDISKFELTLNHTTQTGIVDQLGYNTIGNFRAGPQLDNSSVGVATQNGLNPVAPATVASTPTTPGQLNQNVSLNGPPSQTGQQVSGATSQTQTGTATTNQPASSGIAAQAAVNGTNNAATAGAQARATAGGAAGQGNQQPPPNVTLRQSAYLEDVGSSVFNPDPWVISGRAIVTPIVQNSQQAGDGSPTNTSSAAGPNSIQVSRSLVAQILNECKDAGLARQKLEIRGDPYWLGFSNLDEKNLVGDGNQPAPNGRNDSAWWFSGDCGYVFTMRTGTTYNETTGFMDFNDHTIMWNGFYKVIKLKSNFKNGVFTQELEAVRDPLTSPPDLSGATTNNTPLAATIQGVQNAANQQLAATNAARQQASAQIQPPVTPIT
jgi:hypothetical protein